MKFKGLSPHQSIIFCSKEYINPFSYLANSFFVDKSPGSFYL